MTLQELLQQATHSIGTEIVVRSSLILICTAALTAVLKRKSAAARHLAWTMATVGVLILPGFLLCFPRIEILPVWQLEPAGDVGDIAAASVLEDNVPGRTEFEFVPEPLAASLTRDAVSDNGEAGVAVVDVGQVSQVVEEPTRARKSAGWWLSKQFFVRGWALGFVVMLLPVFGGFLSLWRIRRRSLPVSLNQLRLIDSVATELGIKRVVEGRLSPDRRIPMTWGLWRPTVLLPTDCENWTAARLRLVLVHELAHIRRADYLTQLVGQVVRALYWFNPLSWWALHQLQTEQERACDDYVLNDGTAADEYAAELLAVTTNVPRYFLDTAVSLGISRAARLEMRVAAILDSTSERRPLAPWSTAFAAMLFAGLCIGVGLSGTKQSQASDPRELTQDSPGQAAAADEKGVEKKGVAQEQNVVNPGPNVADERSRILAEAVQKIESLSGKNLSPASVVTDAIRGVIGSLNDPYSTVFTEEQLREFHQQVEGQFAGVGIVMTKSEKGLVALRVLLNSSAFGAGIKSGDEILAVNGSPVLSVAETANKIRGPVGTEVVIRVKTGNEVARDLTLKRAQIAVPSMAGWTVDPDGVSNHWLDEPKHIGYIRISSFTPRLAGEMKTMLSQLTEKGLKGLVLDLRNCPGGVLPETVNVASLFLSDSEVFKVQGQPLPEETISKTGPNAPFKELPLITLIDATTASAGEVLAAALQESGRSILVGERTFGKGSVQALVELAANGPTVRLTTAMLTSPRGKVWHRSPNSVSWGVDPDDGYFVPLTSEQRAEYVMMLRTKEVPSKDKAGQLDADPQLHAALQALDARLKTGAPKRTGRPLAEMQPLLEKTVKLLRAERDQLRERLENLDRALGEK